MGTKNKQANKQNKKNIAVGFSQCGMFSICFRMSLPGVFFKRCAVAIHELILIHKLLQPD